MAIPFHPEHLAAVELGAEEQLEYALLGSGLFSALSEWQGPAWSLTDDGDRILGCIGMLVADRDGVLWAVLSDEARARPFGLHRAAKRYLERVERTIPTGRILSTVRHGFEPGRRWMTRLGFTHDGDFQLGNERYERYVRWAHQQQ